MCIIYLKIMYIFYLKIQCIINKNCLRWWEIFPKIPLEVFFVFVFPKMENDNCLIRLLYFILLIVLNSLSGYKEQVFQDSNIPPTKLLENRNFSQSYCLGKRVSIFLCLSLFPPFYPSLLYSSSSSSLT